MTLNINKSNSKQVLSSLYIAVICFLTYSCVFAFRKPFTVGIYLNMPTYFGIQFKNLLVIAQVLGYALSKIYGVKFISELNKLGRGKLIFILILLSLLPLFIFPLIPPPYSIFCLFLNGFPLGIIWGIIFSFVEGRRGTDFIGAVLGASLILSSGFAKSVAKYLELTYTIKEMWLPFYTGLVFLLPIFILVLLLEKIPEPTQSEILLKTERLPMSNVQRVSFFKKFMPGLLALIFIYIVLTLFRDIRDNFAADIWENLGYGNNAQIFTNSELPTALIVLSIIASMILIKNNAYVFIMCHYMIILGFSIVFIATILFNYQIINGFYWMLFIGLGLYLAYTPFNSILFDRMIATFKLKGNVGFLIYVMDSFGYLASVIIISLKGIFHIQLNWAAFYAEGALYFSIIGFIVTILSLQYYRHKIKFFKYE